MTENTGQTGWPPLRQHPPSTPISVPARMRSAFDSLPGTPSGISHYPRTPLVSAKSRKTHRNGYETAPKTPSYIPFALNNISHPRQKAFTIDNSDRLKPCAALDPSEWTSLAVALRAWGRQG
ncbi:hypothetical protein GGX14DRAFT_606397 [Mycena pura]|uniref:Uncharacterized protein n=1 Tax=Mycena pura TaxID=153505 RepID=A0AAD6UNB8_9AGAR|nr:hypothetical protein GGX14DRAFT_606397 [Mycena pura]